MGSRPQRCLKPHTRSKQVLETLRAYESQNLLCTDPALDWPLVWQRAKGMFVWDLDGNRYLDATSAFGVANCGHSNSNVTTAGCKQLKEMTHAMGDVHPHSKKAELARLLSDVVFPDWHRETKNRIGNTSKIRGKTIFCNSGFEAVEAALKTALLATGRAGVLALEGAYHGLGYGALNTTHREMFRHPFASQLSKFGTFLPFPLNDFQTRQTLSRATALARSTKYGAILIEPIQGRGGVRPLSAELIIGLRRVATEHRMVFIADEIFTGFGRTGSMLALHHFEIFADVYCLGKGLTGGFPLSACVGSADLMDRAWPPSEGESIHTSTFLGHPVGCAMALAQVKEIEQRQLCKRALMMGEFAMSQFLKLQMKHPGVVTTVRGKGLMLGIELNQAAIKQETAIGVLVMRKMAGLGWIVLPEGPEANILSFTPPLIITKRQILGFTNALDQILCELSRAVA